MTLFSLFWFLVVVGGLCLLARKQRSRMFLFIFGVFLPTVTVGLEYTTHIYAQSFFDPLPTNWHLLWVSLVPITIIANRSPAITRIWAKDITTSDGFIVKQTMTEEPVSTPRRVVMVIDGSQGMRDTLPAIAEAFLALPEQIEIAVLIATNGMMNLSIGVWNNSREKALVVADRIRALTNEGGQENVSALIQADQIASERSESVIV